MRTLAVGLLAALLAGAGSALRPARVEAKDPPAGGALAAVLAPVARDQAVPALVAAVVTSDGIQARGVVGVRKRGDATQATLKDLWHLGSCTKSMTATLIGRLVERKMLRFDMTLPEAFPDLAKTMHPGWKTCTLAMLLQNRGGMPGGLHRDGLWERLWTFAGTPREARRLLTKTVLSWPPRNTPGTTYEYSNAGFAVAGHAAESLRDTDYEALLLTEVLAPLKAVPAGFGAPGLASKDVTQPWGHRTVRGGLGPNVPGLRDTPMDPKVLGADNPPAIAPAGTVHMTIDAWARYIQLHLQGARGGAHAKGLLLAPDTLARLHTPPRGETYAMGWGIAERPWAGGRVLTHNGSNTCWYATVWIAPARDVAFLAVANQGGKPGQKATDAAIGALIGWWRARAAK